MSDSLWPQGLPHARLPCPSLSPWVCSNSYLLSQWCHPTISSSAPPSPPPINLSQHQGLFQWVLLYRNITASNKVPILWSNSWNGIIFTLVIPTPCAVLSRPVMSDSLWAHGLYPSRLLSPWEFSSKNTGVGCHDLLQGIFPTQGSNSGLPHCRQILYHLSHQGSPRILEWVAYPISRGSSWPKGLLHCRWILYQLRYYPM